MKWNLRKRISVPTLALVLSITAALVLVPFYMGRAYIEGALDEQQAAITSSTLSQVEDWIAGQRQTLSYWAMQRAVLSALRSAPEAQPTRRELDEQFANAVKLLGNYEMILIADPKGDAIASSNEDSTRGINIADRQYFRDALGGQAVVSEVLASRVSGRPIVVVAVPILEGKTVRGVLLGALDLSWFSDNVIARIKVLRTGYAFLFDESGRLLSHPDKSKILNTNVTARPWGAQILRERRGTMDYTEEGVAYHVVFNTSATLHWGFVVTVPRAEFEAPMYRIGWVSLLIGLGTFALGGAITYLTARWVSRPIQETADHVSASAVQTTAAAAQVSNASQSLAASASQQAAAVEETGATLEELSATTTRNAANAAKVSDLAKQARTAAEKGSVDMRALSAAMHDIKTSSSDIAAIIKTIEDIAFQTNVLALNAAVEAARAGDAGLGFTVVADEVRNLAQRSTQAAKDTAAKIESAIGKGVQGVELNSRVAEGLGEIVQKVREVDELATELANAAGEQTRSITEINSAVTQMNEVIQKNAAVSEETASAAEELNSQAVTMRDSIAGLLELVDGQHRETSVVTGQPREPAVDAASEHGTRERCVDQQPHRLRIGG